MKTLQIATTNDRSFFLDQIEALERKGIECDMIAVSPNIEEYREFKEGLGPLAKRVIPEKGHNIPYYGANAAISHPKIVRAVLENDYDIIHTNGGLTAPFALLQPKRPIVQTFWGSDLMGSYLNGYYPAISKFCARHFDAVIVRNEEMQNTLDTKAHIIPAGIDLEKFRPISRSEARQHVGWDEEKRYVLFPYTPEDDRKNYPLAADVVNEANERVDEEITLQTVYGVPHEEIVYYMNASDALLLTSKLEGSPNTVKEAMACNVPVISTNVGDVQQRLSGVSLSKVGTTKEELVEGLIQVIEHSGRSNGREQVKPLSWDRMSEKIIEVYEGIL